MHQPFDTQPAALMKKNNNCVSTNDTEKHHLLNGNMIHVSHPNGDVSGTVGSRDRASVISQFSTETPSVDDVSLNQSVKRDDKNIDRNNTDGDEIPATLNAQLKNSLQHTEKITESEANVGMESQKYLSQINL